MKLKTSESCTAESEETVAVLPASQLETKKREKNFSAFVFQIRKSRLRAI